MKRKSNRQTLTIRDSKKNYVELAIKDKPPVTKSFSEVDSEWIQEWIPAIKVDR
jgi:hypothetical protein